jgi:hypothetical protein
MVALTFTTIDDGGTHGDAPGTHTVGLQQRHPGINMPPPYVHWAAMRNHAVPSLAIAQLRGDVADVAMAAKMFTATAVFGVLVVVRNVTVLLALRDQAPVNVPMRTCLGDPPSDAGGNLIGGWSRLPRSTWSTAAAIRWPLPRSNLT